MWDRVSEYTVEAPKVKTFKFTLEKNGRIVLKHQVPLLTRAPLGEGGGGEGKRPSLPLIFRSSNTKTLTLHVCSFIYLVHPD